MIIIYVTCRDEDEAKKVSRHLLEKSLIGCANMFPMKSMYRWEEKIIDDEEYVLLLKTNQEEFEDIESEIKKIHSYDVPAIYSWKTDKGNEKYFGWIDKELKK